MFSDKDDFIEETINMDQVQVRLYLDFSDESEKALKTAWEVAEELLDHNIWVEIEPIHYWFNSPLDSEIYDFPKIFINGKLMFIGRAPSKEEFINAILDRIGKYLKREISEEQVFINKYEDGFCEVETIG